MLRASELEACVGFACVANVTSQSSYRFGSATNFCTAVGRAARLSFQRWLRCVPATVFLVFKPPALQAKSGCSVAPASPLPLTVRSTGRPNATRLGSFGLASVPARVTLALNRPHVSNHCDSPDFVGNSSATLIHERPMHRRVRVILKSNRAKLAADQHA